MRDIIRDAAIVTMAQQFKDLIYVETFLELYEDKDSALPDYVLDLLVELGMVREYWEAPDPFDAEFGFKRGQYKYKWSA